MAAVDWWTANAPPDGSQAQIGSQPFQATATAPTTTAPGFTPDPGHGTPVAPGTAPFQTTQGSTDPMDAGYISQQIAAYAQQHQSDPGFDQSLLNDPNYWVQKIQSTGGWQGDNANYWTTKFQTANQGGADPSSNQFGAPPAPYASTPPTVPTYTTPATPSDLSTPYTVTPFTAPTVAQVEAQPGYQIGLNTGTAQIQRSAAARGTVLNPGTVQALNQYGTDYAGTQYQNVLNSDLNIWNANNNAQLSARQQNAGEFQNSVGNSNTQFQNQYSQYLGENSRTLSDYLTNYNIAHTAQTDYWNRLMGVSNSGLSAAQSAKPS